MNETKTEKQSASNGGKREGAGRKRGVPNKVTVELGDAAREYTPLALKTLADICENGLSEQARIAAATALLDRGYGKPKQVVDPVSVSVSSITAIKLDEPHSASLAWLESVISESEQPRLLTSQAGEEEAA